MIIITANDLKTGDVIWWAGDQNWSRHIADAQDAGDQAEAIIARESAARRANEAYAVPAKPSALGPMPDHIKERIRAHGPTVRADLAINTKVPVTSDELAG